MEGVLMVSLIRTMFSKCAVFQGSLSCCVPTFFLEKKRYLRISFVSETITELLCNKPGATCGAISLFSCKQMKSLMEVAYKTSNSTESEQSQDIEESQQLQMANITINSGCSCTVMIPILYNKMAPGIPEKQEEFKKIVPEFQSRETEIIANRLPSYLSLKYSLIKLILHAHRKISLIAWLLNS